MGEKSKFVIGENTPVTVGVLIAVIGLTAWLTVNAKATSDLQQKMVTVDQMAIDVAVIKSQVFEINHKIDKENE